MNKTFDEFYKQFNGIKVDPYDPNNAFQCMDLATQWCMDGFGLPNTIFTGLLWPSQIFNTPTDIVKINFDFIKNTIDNKPEQGDIVIFPGHIVVATGEGDLTNFRAFSQNDPIGSPCVINTYNYNQVLGWLRYNPKLLVPIKDNEENVKFASFFKEVCTLFGLPVTDDRSLDEIKRLYAEKEVSVQGEKNQVEKLKKDLEKANIETKEYKDGLDLANKKLGEATVEIAHLKAGTINSQPQPGPITKPDTIQINLSEVWSKIVELFHHIFIVQKGEIKHE
jgi:hypothetical protein